MDKESIIELQKIDCNCNDCKFLERDFEKYSAYNITDTLAQALNKITES